MRTRSTTAGSMNRGRASPSSWTSARNSAAIWCWSVRASAATSRWLPPRSCTPVACSSWRRRCTWRDCRSCASGYSTARPRSCTAGAMMSCRMSTACASPTPTGRPCTCSRAIIGCTTSCASSSTCSNTFSSPRPAGDRLRVTLSVVRGSRGRPYGPPGAAPAAGPSVPGDRAPR